MLIKKISLIMRPFDRTINLIGAYLFAALLLSTAYTKIADFDNFLKQFESYQALPSHIFVAGKVVDLLHVGAWAAIGAEIFLGLSVIIGLLRRWALRGIALLMFTFAVAMSFALFEGREIECGCNIPLIGEAMVTWGLVLRNILLACVAILLSITPEAGKPFWSVAFRKITKKSFTLIGTSIVIFTSLAYLHGTVLTGKLYVDLVQCRREHPGLPPGTPFPPLTLQGLDGSITEVDFSKGTSTFAFFFSMRCPHCKKIASWWEKLYQDYRNTYQFFAIAVGNDEQVAQFKEKTKIHFPIYRLAGDRERKDYRVFGFPRTILVDSRGLVRAFVRGNIPEEGKRAFERAYLKRVRQTKPPPPTAAPTP